MSEAPVVELVGVGRAYAEGARRRQVLSGFNLSVAPGEMVAIVGPSGCGKTTILSIVGALDSEYEGEAKLAGRSLAKLSDDERTRIRNEELGFVFQSFHLLEHLSVAENVALPLWLLAQAKPDADARVKEVLEAVGLSDRGEESVRLLSGGERQRVAIARAMVNKPRLLLADEPTGNLDRATGARIAELFSAVRDQSGSAVLIATHDRVLADRANRVIDLEATRA